MCTSPVRIGRRSAARGARLADWAGDSASRSSAHRRAYHPVESRSRLPRRPPGDDPGLVHAAGRPVAAGVSGVAGRHRDARRMPRPGHGQRDHLAAGAAPQRRRGHLLQRHRRAHQARGGRRRHRARTRPGARCPDPHARGCRSARAPRPSGLAPDRRGSRAHRRGTRIHPPHRLRGSPLHPGGVPRRGWSVERPPPRSHPDARRTRHLECPDDLGGRGDRGVPPRAGDGGGIRRTTLRLVGGIVVTRRLFDLCGALFATRSDPCRRSGGADRALRGRHRRTARGDA